MNRWASRVCPSPTAALARPRLPSPSFPYLPRHFQNKPVLHHPRAHHDHERVERAESEGEGGPGRLGEVDERLGVEVLLEREIGPFQDGKVLEELGVVRLRRLWA